MKAIVAALLMASALGGCAERYYAGGPPPAPPSPSPMGRRPPVDACGASSMQYLVGRSVSEVPGGYAAGGYRRVIGHRSYVEDHYIAERLTIVFNEDSGRVTRVRCG